MKKKMFVEMDYNEFDDLVNEFYQTKRFNCVAAEEWSNYEDHSFEVKKEKISSYDQETIEELKTDKCPNWSVNIALQELVNNDIIPEGNILITVNW